MGILDVFIPMDRRVSLAAGQTLPDRTKGAVLFADISGFTHFSQELFNELGSQLGAEVLTQQLNEVYGALIDVIHRYRGSVITFAGDAITCWFDDDDGRRATAAALEMQGVMVKMEHLTTPAGTTHPMGIKVSVTSGNARRFVVGRPRVQRIEVLAGEILDRMAAAEKQLKSGEVVVGSEVMGRLGNQAIVEEWRRDETGEHFAVLSGLTEPITALPWASIPDLDPQVAREWLLPPVYQRLVRGEGDFLAELRPAVAMFIKFQGIDYDADDQAGENLDRFISWMQEILSDFGGLLLELIIGDKGSYVFSSFGARVTHEDDVDRALSASLELLNPPGELSFVHDIQIGITRGQVRVGTYGGPTRRNYGAHGNTVNLAARLMENAKPGHIMTSSRIKKEASRKFNFLDLEPIPLKGFEKPFPVYELASAVFEKPLDLLGASIYPLVGRSVEKGAISECLRALLDGKSTNILIEGDAGIGKTSLVEYAHQQAQQAGVKTLVGVGDEVSMSSLYYAWRPVFRGLLGLDPSSAGTQQSLEQRSAAVVDQLAYLVPESVHLAPLLNEILAVEIQENELTQQMTGEVRAENIRILFVTLLTELARENPLMVILEDAHWFDSASWELLQNVTRDVNPIMFVVTYRPLPDPVPSVFTGLLEAPDSRQLCLERLSSEDIETLILQRLNVKQLPQPVIDIINQKAEGNPFFSEELAYALRDQDLIRIEDEKLIVSTSGSDFGALDFPDTSQDVIRSRIDRLAAQEQLVLKIASVIGRTYQYRLLRDIHPVEMDKPHLSDYLDDLEHRALTRQVSPEPELTYRFQHNIIHEVAYNLMLFTQRRDLHRSIAEWHELHYAGELSPMFPVLAHHWSRTENSAKAIEYLEKAAQQAMRSFANREVINYLKDAFSHLDKAAVPIETEREAGWELLLGEAYVNLFDNKKGRQHIERGLKLLGTPVPDQNMKQYAGVIGQVLKQVLHRAFTKLYLGRGADQRERLLEASRACERLVEVYFGMNEIALSLYTAFRTLNLAESAGISPELARGYATVGALIGFIPVHGIANAYLQRALDTVDEVDDLNARTWVNIVVAYYNIGVGKWTEAAQLLEGGLSIAERLGDQRRREDILGNLFALKYLQGKFEASAAIADRLVELARRRGADYSLATGLQGKAYTALHMGRFADAMQCLHELRALFDEQARITDEALLIEMDGLLALTHLRQSEIEQSLETAGHGLESGAGATPSNYSSFTGYAAPACVYLALWEAGHPLPEIEKAAWKACKNLRKFVRVFPIAEPRALLYEGWYFWLSGKHARANDSWRKSLESASDLGMRYDEGLAHYEIGRHLPAGDPERADHLIKARDIFAETGAAFDQARAQAELDG